MTAERNVRSEKVETDATNDIKAHSSQNNHVGLIERCL